MAKLTGNAEWVEPEERYEIRREARDDMFLEVAVRGKTTYVVRGDQDLLALDAYENIRIGTPRDFLDRSSELQS